MAKTLIEWTWRRMPLPALTLSQLQFALDIGAVQDGGEIILPGYTFNPWIGCSKVSPGCLNCYAAAMDLRRFSKTLDGASKDAPVVHWGPGAPRHRTSEATWRNPIKWDRHAHQLGVRLRVFCASLSDWLDDEVSLAWLADLLCLVATCPHLDWLLVTKRPENWRPRLEAMAADDRLPIDARNFARIWLGGGVWQNIWFLVSTEDQERADERVPLMLQIPAIVHGISAEPLLGPLRIGAWTWGVRSTAAGVEIIPGLDWIIIGAESGNERRSMRPQWAEDIVRAAGCVGCAVFMKQMEIAGRITTDVSEFPATLQERGFPR